jgi:hypothetical protein
MTAPVVGARRRGPVESATTQVAGLLALGATIAPLRLRLLRPRRVHPLRGVLVAINLTIGLVDGGYPANRAAWLRPVDALRDE